MTCLVSFQSSKPYEYIDIHEKKSHKFKKCDYINVASDRVDFQLRRLFLSVPIIFYDRRWQLNANRGGEFRRQCLINVNLAPQAFTFIEEIPYFVSYDFRRNYFSSQLDAVDRAHT